MLRVFIDCYTTDDLTGLIISGKPTDEQLKAHFQEILIDYYDLIGHEQTKTYIMLQKQAIKLASKINQMVIMMQVYLMSKNAEIKKLLAKNGFYFQADSAESIIIKQFEGYITSLKIDLSHKEKDIEKLGKSGAPAQATRETFITNIIEMGKENFNIDMEKHMTEYYALTLKSFNLFIEAKIQNAA